MEKEVGEEEEGRGRTKGEERRGKERGRKRKRKTEKKRRGAVQRHTDILEHTFSSLGLLGFEMIDREKNGAPPLSKLPS